MKVLVAGPLPLPINGCSYANDILAQGLRKLGHSVVCLNTSSTSLSETHGQNFSLRKAMGFMHIYLHLWKIAAVDVVYITPGQTFFGLIKYAPIYLVSALFSRPCVTHIHGNYLGQEFARLSGIRRRVFGYLVSRSSAGIALSESLRGNFAGMLPAERVHVVENFCGDDLLAFREAHVKPRDMVRILYLSNLMREKGVLDLLDALILLRRSGVAFSATLAGEIPSGQSAGIEARLRELKGAAEYVGTVQGDEKMDLLIARSNVFILPTYYSMEGQPISILEALAAGNVIVTTAHAGIPDVVNESHGAIVRARDPVGIAEVVTRISEDLEKYLRIGNGNAIYARGRFRTDQFIAGVHEVLARSIERSAA